MAETKIVLGSLFGDEGKGATVQWLCKQAIIEGKHPLVIRFSGGPQAGHTVMNDNVTHICSSFGSGVLLGVPTYYTDNAVIDPICLVTELKELIKKGIPEPKINCYQACLITPYDVEYNRSNELQRFHGTCGKGVWATIHRINTSDSGYCMLFDDPEPMLISAAEYYHVPRNEEYDKLFKENFYFLKDYLATHQTHFYEHDVYIYEGSQGLLLDAERGFRPYVTATTTGVQTFSEKELHNAEIYLVTRSYLTRHGNGYTPSFPFFPSDNYETNQYNQYQGAFKVGIIDFDLLNRAFERHCLDNLRESHLNLVITHIDEFKHKMFQYIDKGKLMTSFDRDIPKQFVRHLSLDFDKVFYSDNPFSSFQCAYM